MQRDMKIGMALGVALVGIVGALFFRREPEAGHDKTPPPLPNVEQLDREIAEKAKTPYIQGLEEFDAPSAPVPLPPSTTTKSNSGAKSDKSQETAAGKSATTPEPLRSTKSDTAATETAPAHNRDWEPTGPSTTPGKKAGESPRGPTRPDRSPARDGRTSSSREIRSRDWPRAIWARAAGIARFTKPTATNSAVRTTFGKE